MVAAIHLGYDEQSRVSILNFNQIFVGGGSELENVVRVLLPPLGCEVSDLTRRRLALAGLRDWATELSL